jgi:hypothetical protein
MSSLLRNPNPVIGIGLPRRYRRLIGNRSVPDPSHVDANRPAIPRSAQRTGNSRSAPGQQKRHAPRVLIAIAEVQAIEKAGG